MPHGQGKIAGDSVARSKELAPTMDESPRSNERQSSVNPARSAPLLRRADQTALATILVVCLVGMGWFVFRLGVIKQGVIDLDHRPNREAQLQVDLNLAPWPEFANLPGIGEHLGRSIVSYRHQHGEFRSVDDVQLVPGIGESRFRQIKPYLVITSSVRR